MHYRSLLGLALLFFGLFLSHETPVSGHAPTVFNGHETYLDNAQTVKFYLYDITNSAAMLSSGQLPVFSEIGPFEFQKYPCGPDQSVYVYSWSPFNLTKTITTLNAPFQYAVDALETTPLGTSVLSFVYGNVSDYDKLFVTRNIQDLLFGYPDPHLAAIHQIFPGFLSSFPGLVNFSITNNNPMNPKSPYGKYILQLDLDSETDKVETEKESRLTIKKSFEAVPSSSMTALARETTNLVYFISPISLNGTIVWLSHLSPSFVPVLSSLLEDTILAIPTETCSQSTSFTQYTGIASMWIGILFFVWILKNQHNDSILKKGGLMNEKMASSLQTPA